MKPSECVAILKKLKRAYPRQNVTSATIELYAEMLVDLDRDDVRRAVGCLVAMSKWFPTVAEIREAVAGAAVDGLPDAGVAWGEVRKAVSRFGSYRVPEFSCPEVASAVEVVGWATICLDENVMSTRARFVDAYRAIRERVKRGEQLGEFAPAALREETRARRHVRLADASALKRLETQPEPTGSPTTKGPTQ